MKLSVLPNYLSTVDPRYNETIGKGRSVRYNEDFVVANIGFLVYELIYMS